MPTPLRRLALSGDYADPDRTNPANPLPSTVGLFKVTKPYAIFEIIGKSSTDVDATEVDVGTLEVDAWVGTLGELRDPNDPASGRTVRRGESVIEANLAALSGRIRLISSDLTVGSTCFINLALTLVGALTAVDVNIVEGGRRT